MHNFMYIFVSVIRSVTSFWQVMHLGLNLDLRPSMKQELLGSYVDTSFLSNYFLCVMESGKVLLPCIRFVLPTFKNRLLYIVYALEHMLECSQQYETVGILYDVACTLQKHLKV